jgi:hypothetical protein
VGRRSKGPKEIMRALVECDDGCLCVAIKYGHGRGTWRDLNNKRLKVVKIVSKDFSF